MPAVRPRAWLALALLASACTPTHRPPPAARADDDATPTREPPASDPLDDDAFLALTRAFADQLARDTRVALARPVSTREQAYAVISTLALAHPEQAAAGARVLERHGVRPEQLARYVDAHPERAQFLASEAYAPLDALRPEITAWRARVATLPGAARPPALWSPAWIPPWPAPAGPWPPWP